MKFCTGCGKQLEDETRFCGGCGKEVRASAPQAPAQTPPKATAQATQAPRRIVRPVMAKYLFLSNSF